MIPILIVFADVILGKLAKVLLVAVYTKCVVVKKDRNSLLYQDILRYSINDKYKDDEDVSSRLWYLTKWLLEVNQYFIDCFKSPKKTELYNG